MSDTIVAPPAPVPSRAVPLASNGFSTAARPLEPEIVVPEIGAPDASATDMRTVASEQLARIEDKTSRIEEKFARSEAAMQRVVDRFDQASNRMGEVALQSELAAVRGEVAFIARRVRNMPGMAALAVTALAAAVLSAVIFVLILRYVPGLALR